VQAEDLAYTGLVRQREMLANPSLEARELMSLHLDRIERLNPRRNAFVSVRADAALREAEEAQQSLDRGDPRPLLGIPFAIKDEHDLAGEVTSHGTGATARVAQRDSEIVAILRKAGAIPVGKTALPELGMHPFTESVTWGVTRNPWDVSRTPCGSSGGSAEAVAAGRASFATAGDGGGSIRIPASCCKLFGQQSSPGWSDASDPAFGDTDDGVPLQSVGDTSGLECGVGRSFSLRAEWVCRLTWSWRCRAGRCV
jgi:amidase